MSGSNEPNAKSVALRSFLGPILSQEICHLRPVLVQGQGERGLTFAIANVYVGAVIEEQLCDFGFSISHTIEKRRRAIGIPRVHIRIPADQFLNERNMAVPNGMLQGRAGARPEI